MAGIHYDVETLKTWTTASLVLHLAKYASWRRPTNGRKNAELVAAELNARIPPRAMPQAAPKTETP